MSESPKYEAGSWNNFRNIPQMADVPGKVGFDIGAVGNVLPLRVNRFVTDALLTGGDPMIMPADPGKVQVPGECEVPGEKVLQLRFLQGRNPGRAHRPFFAQQDEAAVWLDDLKAAFGEKEFFFENGLDPFCRESLESAYSEDSA